MVGASMFRYAAVAAAGALLALGGLQVVTGPAAHAAADAPLRGSQGSAPEPARLFKTADGHFWADARVDGAPVHFLVDTGASSVFLTPDDAERLGLHPTVYDQTVRTVGGDSLAARVKLDSVSVNGVRVDGVDALVIGRGLPASLLGMSYLGRLSRFEATPASLVLDP
jgi:aspartyl protease family protein